MACVDEREFRLTPKAAAPFQKETRHCGPLGGEGFKVDDERRTASGWLTEQGKDAGPLGGGITALSGSSREAAYRLQHLHFFVLHLARKFDSIERLIDHLSGDARVTHHRVWVGSHSATSAERHVTPVRFSFSEFLFLFVLSAPW